MSKTDLLASAVILALLLLLAALVLSTEQLVRAAFVFDAIAAILFLIDVLTEDTE